MLFTRFDASSLDQYIFVQKYSFKTLKSMVKLALWPEKWCWSSKKHDEQQSNEVVFPYRVTRFLFIYASSVYTNEHWQMNTCYLDLWPGSFSI